jgi:hypothetical protein
MPGSGDASTVRGETSQASVMLTKVSIQSHEAMLSIILDPDVRQDDGVKHATSPDDLTAARAYMRSTEQKEDA